MTALAEVRLISTEHAGYEQAVSLERLPQLVDRIVVFLDTAIAKRDPSAALPSAAAAEGRGADHGVDGGAAADARTGVVRSNTDAAAALAAVADYFSRREPSSPALLLVRQAQQLIGKSFLEVMQILMPAHVEQANVSIGGDQAFELPVQQLAKFADTYDSSESPSKPAVDGAGSETAITESNTLGPAFLVNSRQEAIVLMEQVVGYFGTAEPSSPVPHLVSRARSLANRDFMSILKDFLPESALKSMKNNGAEAP
jgi:type VI secretion system protein ImpA